MYIKTVHIVYVTFCHSDIWCCRPVLRFFALFSSNNFCLHGCEAELHEIVMRWGSDTELHCVCVLRAKACLCVCTHVCVCVCVCVCIRWKLILICLFIWNIIGWYAQYLLIHVCILLCFDEWQWKILQCPSGLSIALWCHVVCFVLMNDNVVSLWTYDNKRSVFHIFNTMIASSCILF